MTKSPIIGIDLGTTNSCVGVWQNDHVEIIENNLGHRTTPSYVAFDKNERLIGESAKYKAAMNPKNTIYNVKRLMGQNFKKLQSDLKNFPFEVNENFHKPHIQVEHKNEKYEFLPDEISSMILSKMKEIAEDYLGQPVTDAVISVPAYFNYSQRMATINAAHIAGLKVLRLINEPTAAALAYGFNNNKTETTGGDTHLGGEDFNNRMMDYFIKNFKEKYNKDLTSSSKSMYRLRVACEKAKHDLSLSTEASIDIVSLFDDIDFNSIITRSCFEEINSDLFDKIIQITENVLKDSNLKKSDINEIILVGGSTYIPKIQNIFSSYFDGKKINKTVNINEAVTCGATLQAAILSEKTSRKINNFVISDIIPFSLGIYNIKKEEIENIIDRNSTLPIKCSKTFYLQDININKSNNYYGLNLFHHLSNNRQCEIKFAIHEEDNFLAYNLLEAHNLKSKLQTAYNKVKISIELYVDPSGIYYIKFKSKNISFNTWDVEYNSSQLYNNQINEMINKANWFKEEDKKEKERTESMDNLEKCAYDIRASLKNDKKLYQTFSNYINYLTNCCDDTIKFVKNNQSAKKEEYEKYINELNEIYKPITKISKIEKEQKKIIIKNNNYKEKVITISFM
ncbi:hypothetical protein PIROE2DRAFT_5610 [Piromyces sp. E2]|nr:hypothetical protein PIROE2DRAFT_5610 [Piromyces sp. E2]|eukprot:OUM67006.1 hypothetical protein PIROE2DRAFT_5610 [Piromyces sp. E2]